MNINEMRQSYLKNQSLSRQSACGFWKARFAYRHVWLLCFTMLPKQLTFFLGSTKWTLSLLLYDFSLTHRGGSVNNKSRGSWLRLTPPGLRACVVFMFSMWLRRRVVNGCPVRRWLPVSSAPCLVLFASWNRLQLYCSAEQDKLSKWRV